MAGKKDPSIYDDRSSIGSADELDEYGVWVKSEPQDLSNSVPDIEELPDFDDLLDNEESDNNVDQEEEDVSLDSKEIEFEEIPENLDLPEGPAPTSVDGDGFMEVSMTDFLDSSSGPKEQETIDFGNLDSSVPEVEVVESIDNTVPASGKSSGGKDLSTQLLQRIADELSSIKKEISSLKSELSVVRGEIKTSESTESTGFFDEEDDEKIALTGDELDNILNTANFTEETGSGESESVDIDFDEDLSELDGAIKVEDEVKISNTDDFDISLDLTTDSMDDSVELDALREEGAMPITDAPEDTSYLEEDPLASFDSTGDEAGSVIAEIDETFTDAVDLSGAVIDEPDLSSGIIENPVTEPSIDNISIDLDMEEIAHDTSPEDVSGSDDFVFETEETMEIPTADLPDIDEDFPVIENTEEDIISEADDALEFAETVPKGLYDQTSSDDGIPNNLKQELKIVLSYMDQLLESLPEDKIEEFAKSEYFDTYKKLFEELGLV
ncbi:MAG: hypothetical protein FWG07_09685 [Treponema sp.]|nr:hypothetical protein [Treponema sp.]